MGARAPILVETKANARWPLDFVHDQFASGRRFRVLNIVNDVTCECLAAIPDTSISGRRVVRELIALTERRGKPDLIVSDNDPDLTANAVLSRAQDAEAAWHFDGFCKSFNRRMRDELLNETLFLDLDHAREKIVAWVDDHNNRRSHSALVYQTPTAYVAHLPATCYRPPNPNQLRGSMLLTPSRKA